MKAMILVISWALILLAAGSAPAVDATASLDLNSAYVWRGLTFNDGPVAQPSLDVTRCGFGLNIWGNFDIGDYDGTLDDHEFSEIDLTLSYGFSLGRMGINLGLIEYLFPAGGSGTREAYVSLGVPLAGGLSIGTTAYYDWDEVQGWYITAEISYGRDLNEKLGIEAAAIAGFTDEDYAEAYGGEGGGFYDYKFSLGLSYSITEALSLKSGINYTDTLNEDALPEVMVDANLYGGINFSYLF